jgi:potassium efflux system protein
MKQPQLGRAHLTSAAHLSNEIPWRLWCVTALGLFVVAAIVGLGGPAQAQTNPQSSSPSAESSIPPAVPLAAVATESQSALASLREMRASLTEDRRTETALRRLPVLTRQVDGRVRENRGIIAQKPSIDTLRSAAEEWAHIRGELSRLNRELTDRVKDLEAHLTRLAALANIWEQTLSAAQNAGAPPEIINQIQTVITQIRQAREEVDRERAQALTALARIGVQDARIADALRVLDQARERALSQLFQQDSAPLWSATLLSATVQNLQQQTLMSFSTQSAALVNYVETQGLRFALAIGIFIALALALILARRRLRHLAAESRGPSGETRALEAPIAAALILTLLSSRWIFPYAPRLLWTLVGILALVPSIIILRRLIPANYLMLHSLVAFSLFDQVRGVVAAVSLLPRLFLLAEMAGAIFFLLCLGRFVRQSSLWSSENHRKMIKLAAYAGLLLACVALIANILGYVTLASVLGNTLVQGIYLALILYAFVAVLDGLVNIALSVPPLAKLAAVRRHQSLLQRRIGRTLRVLAVVLWILAILKQHLLLERLVQATARFLSADFGVGSIQISFGDILAFALIVWGSFLVSRFVRFLLEEDFCPRINLKRGVAYAVSITLHYSILLIGFFFAVAALGFDMTRVAILTGAFGVGVGFGLQDIFKNFISGLILLFERPINVDDVVQIGDATGVVERIGIRASIIRTAKGSNVIVPNGKLISENLINWTLPNRQVGIELPIAVAEKADSQHVITLLEKTAAAHPLVTRDPPPQALVVKLSADALGLELRAWTDHSEKWMQIRSELAIAIRSALAAEQIAIR